VWVPDDNAPCVGNGRHLGVPIDIGDGTMVTYHGEGVQQKRLLEISEIPVSLYADTHDNAQEYADSINYDKCMEQGSVQKLCKIEATSTSKWMGCSLPGTEIGWASHNYGAVYTKPSAEAYMADASKFGELELEPAVSRQQAIEIGVLNDKGEVIDLSAMPKGYIIQYKAANTSSYDEDLKNDCTIVQLVEAEAPRKAEDCEIENVNGDCFSVSCGTRYSRTVTPTLKKQAWGLGTCDVGDEYIDTRSCATFELPCCVKGNDFHYNSGGCIEGIETFTQDTGECSIKNLNGGVSSYTEDCCYVGDWEEVGCNLDEKLDHMKYTREIINKDMCRNSDFSKGVNVNNGDIFSYDYDKVNVKYVPNTEDCYSTCVRQQVDGVKPPYKQDWGGGGHEGGQPYHSNCRGTIKYKLTQEGKGSGKSHSSCTNFGLQNKKLGDTWTELASIENNTCPAEHAACVHTNWRMDNAPCRPYTNKRDCDNKKYLSSQKQCKWVGHE